MVRAIKKSGLYTNNLAVSRLRCQARKACLYQNIPLIINESIEASHWHWLNTECFSPGSNQPLLVGLTFFRNGFVAPLPWLDTSIQIVHNMRHSRCPGSHNPENFLANPILSRTGALLPRNSSLYSRPKVSASITPSQSFRLSSEHK